MMRSCGICFLHRRAGTSWADDPHDEYIVPELLPEREAMAARLVAAWDEDAPSETLTLRYPLLHEGLMCTVMAQVGQLSGANAVYWKGGFCGFEARTRSRLLIEQQVDECGMRGILRIRAQHGEAAALLYRALRLVEEAEQQIGLRHEERVERASPRREAEDATPITLTAEKPPMPAWYVSYAWRDDHSPGGLTREEKVDAACEDARARGKVIHRDKDDLQPGDSIQRFMQAIGAGDRIFVFLSDKYLKSEFCMFELCEVWRQSRQDPDALRQRLRIWTLDDADVWTKPGRARYARHWRERHAELEPLVADLGGLDLLAWQRMRTFHHEVGDILATIADTVQPRDFNAFLSWGFDDPPP